MKVEIEQHRSLDKSFDVTTSHLCLRVDYDDVHRPEVDAAALVLKEVLEAHWNEERYKELYKEAVMKIWNANEYNLQSDYENLEEYLSDNNL